MWLTFAIPGALARFAMAMVVIPSLVATAVLSTSCNHTPNAVILQCPELQQYTEAEQKAALAELMASEGHNANVRTLLNDYHRLRNACRALAASGSGH